MDENVKEVGNEVEKEVVDAVIKEAENVLNSHEAYEAKRNEMKEKYKAVYEGMQEEFPTYTADDLFDMFIAVCRNGQCGLKEVKIVDGKAILVYAAGEVDLDELKKDYAELKGYADENAKEYGL